MNYMEHCQGVKPTVIETAWKLARAVSEALPKASIACRVEKSSGGEIQPVCVVLPTGEVIND